MASETYLKAQKSARTAYRKAVSDGEYPYLPALDDMIDQRQVQTEESLGLVNIPLDQIVGTKTAGRKSAFAGNFMPLMPDNSEFAFKWDSVMKYHLDQGIADPIIAYEFMNRFYVLEGNKRVSVLKYVQADSIEGTVTRLIPYPEDTADSRIYFEFLDFYKDSQVNYIWFSKQGSFEKLTEALGKKRGEKWTDEEKADFRSLYNRFSQIFAAKRGDTLPVTPADGLLFYLSLYPYETVKEKTQAEISADVDKIWAEFSLLSDEHPVDSTVVLKPEDTGEKGIFSRFFAHIGAKQLKVAFLHNKPTELSSWTYSHELGRLALNDRFGDKIRTEAHFLKDEDGDISELLEQTIAAGNHLIFTTSTRFLAASLKASIEHPEVKILNCSVGQPHPAMRTYYGRLYEAKFLGGMIAGAMTANDRIAYQAPQPDYGAVADINAFTLGARMTNPRAKVYLHWASQKDAEPLHELLSREDIRVISDNDTITPASKERMYGLYMTGNGLLVRLATPLWNWGRFYERIIGDFLQGSWEAGKETKEKDAVNYWWGISGGIIDLVMSDDLPKGIAELTAIIKGQMQEDYFKPFRGTFRTQDGRLIGQKDAVLTPQEIITMDYLAEGVIGSIPSMEQLTDEARELIRMERGITPDATTVG